MNSANQVVKLHKVSNACHLCHAKDLCMASSLIGDDLERFADVVGHHKPPMQRGDRLFMAGDDIKSIFILHSGSVKSYIESSDGDNQITGFHLPGDVLGLHGIDGHVHTGTVEALETSSVCEIKSSSLDSIIEAFPKLQSKFLRLVLREMDHEQKMLLVLGKMTAERRIAHFLLDISSRLKEHGLSSERINLSMTRHDIANYLGLAVETVSRILTRFQRSGIIEVERRFILLKDHDRLDDTYNRANTSTA
ncbi:MAG: CRP/FNR family transcriptional regulator [Porticoccaceae bacterium]|jgi:CRP/FNR family transcriptional regulator